MKRIRVASLTLALASLALGGFGMAQQSTIPPEVTATVRALGSVQNNETIESARALYGPPQPVLGPQILVKADLAYGPDERQELDVFAPAQKPAQSVPVVIFLHGGAYIRGDKTTPGTPFHQNIAAFWVRNGMVGVNAPYRLAPKHKWPTAAQDVAAAASWVRTNIPAGGRR